MKRFVADRVVVSRFLRGVRIVAPVALRAVLYGFAVASLCLASIVWASGASATPRFSTQLLIALAVSAALNGWALARAARFKALLDAGAVDIGFCAPHRRFDDPVFHDGGVFPDREYAGDAVRVGATSAAGKMRTWP